MTIQEFTNIEFGELRIIKDDNGMIWFCAADICRALDILQPTKALNKLEEDEKGVTLIHTLGGPQNMLIVNESGLYRLIFRSDKPNAKPFQYWVFHEVLPKLRQGNINNGTLYAPAFIAPQYYIDRYNALQEQCDYYQQQNQQYQQQIQQYQNTIQTQQNTINTQNDYINQMNYKASYYDDCMCNTHIIRISQIAKDFNMSPQKLHSILYHLHIVYPCNDDWIISKRYEKCGYTITQNKNNYKIITGWTESGRQFIYDLLINNGYIRNI